MGKTNKIPNYERLRQIIAGEDIPQNMEESCFYIAYERAKLGDLLMNLITTFPLVYDRLTDFERDHLIYGYALGQEYYAVFEMEAEYDDDTTH